MKYQQGVSQVIIIVGVVLLLAAGGATAFLLTRGGDSDVPSTDAASHSTENDEHHSSDQYKFAPKSTAGVSYVATVNGKAGESTIAATVEYDRDGNLHYLGTAPEPAEMYKIGEEYIICDDAMCMATAASSQPAGSSQAAVNDSDIESWQATAVHKGKQACPAGTCDTWQVAKDGYTGVLYLASDGRVSRSTWTKGTDNIVVDLEYKDVMIIRPENVHTMPTM